MEEKKLSLTHYLELCLNFRQDPTQTNLDKINEFINLIEVKEYMPLKDKIICLVDIMHINGDQDYDAPGAASVFEMNKLIYGLFRYCINLDDDTGIIGPTYGAYDDFMQYGLVKAIKSKCADDYANFCELFDNTVNLTNLYRLVQTASLLNNTEYDKWVQTMKDLKTELNSDVIKDLIAVNMETNASFKELKTQLSKEALEQANREILNEERKQELIQESIGKTDNAEDN